MVYIIRKPSYTAITPTQALNADGNKPNFKKCTAVEYK